MKLFGLSCIALICMQSLTIAQVEYKGLPDDLDTEKIIFIKHDSITDPSIKTMKYHNKNVGIANKELIEAAKLYPFRYVLAYRKDIQKYHDLGYTYVLDFPPFVHIPKGEYNSNTRTRYEYPLYIQNLTTNDTYIIEYMSENVTYWYGPLIKGRLIKRVKKKYKGKI